MIDEYETIKQLALKYGIDLGEINCAPDEDIQVLLDEGLTLEEINIDYFSFCAFRIHGETDIRLLEEYEQQLELLSLALLYTKAVNNNSPVKSDTTIKGVAEKTRLKNNANISRILKCLNDLSGNNSGELYSETELTKLIESKKEYIRQCKRRDKSKKRDNVRRIAYDYQSKGIFSKDVKMLTSKEFQFLYDVLYLEGVFTSENDGLDITPTAKKERLKDYFKYFEDSNVRIKMYDVGRNPLNKLSKPIGEIVSEIGWHPKDNYLKVEAHYKRPERSFGQLSVKDLTNPDCQQIFKRDLYSQYKRLEPMKSIIYPTNKKDLSSIDIVLIELAETLINNGKSLNEIKRALYNRINSFSDEEWKKTDKDSRKRQIKARIGKLRVAENSKWDLSEELKNALFSEK